MHRHHRIHGFVTLLGAALLSSCSIYNCAAPSDAQVEKFFASYEKLPEEVKQARATAFLQSLMSPQTVEDDMAVTRAANLLAATYSRLHDERLLAALDAVDGIAGAMTSLCGVYAALKTDPVFISRYSKSEPAQARLWRCIGLSISDADFAVITGRPSSSVKGH